MLFADVEPSLGMEIVTFGRSLWSESKAGMSITQVCKFLLHFADNFIDVPEMQVWRTTTSWFSLATALSSKASLSEQDLPSVTKPWSCCMILSIGTTVVQQSSCWKGQEGRFCMVAKLWPFVNENTTLPKEWMLTTGNMVHRYIHVSSSVDIGGQHFIKPLKHSEWPNYRGTKLWEWCSFCKGHNPLFAKHGWRGFVSPHEVGRRWNDCLLARALCEAMRVL